MFFERSSPINELFEYRFNPLRGANLGLQTAYPVSKLTLLSWRVHINGYGRFNVEGPTQASPINELFEYRFNPLRGANLGLQTAYPVSKLTLLSWRVHINGYGRFNVEGPT